MTTEIKTAFAFPGAGVEPCGYENPFYRRHETLMKPYLTKASDFAHYDFVAALLGDAFCDLDERNSQVFAYAYGHATAMVYLRSHITPSCVAGYSLGVYAALSASGAFSYETGLEIVAQAFDIMKENCANPEFAMGAVVGLCSAEIAAMLSEPTTGSLVIANTNNKTCSIVCGLPHELEAFFSLAKTANVFSTKRLPVHLPYHHPVYMANASKRFAAYLLSVPLKDPIVPLVSSVNQALLRSAADCRAFIAANLCTPIHWQKVVETMHANRITTLYECGPGISLLQNGRFIDNDISYITIKKTVRSAAS